MPLHWGGEHVPIQWGHETWRAAESALGCTPTLQEEWLVAELAPEKGERTLASDFGFLSIPGKIKRKEKIKNLHDNIYTIFRFSTVKRNCLCYKLQASALTVSHLQGKRLCKIHSDIAVVFPQHSDNPSRHTPQTLILLGLALQQRRGGCSGVLVFVLRGSHYAIQICTPAAPQLLRDSQETLCLTQNNFSIETWVLSW